MIDEQAVLPADAAVSDTPSLPLNMLGDVAEPSVGDERTTATDVTRSNRSTAAGRRQVAARVLSVSASVPADSVEAQHIAAARSAGGPSARTQDWLPLADVLSTDNALAQFSIVRFAVCDC